LLKEVLVAISLTWHGHATFNLNVNGTNVLIDPFFSGNPVAKVTADEVPADFILITHGHGDHVGDAVAIARRTGALVISNFEICNWVSAQGHGKTHAQNSGGTYDHPFGSVKMTPAIHSSGLPDGSDGGIAAGFLLGVGGKRIYISGDTALFSDMQLVGDNIDLATFPIGGNFTMGPDDALQAVRFVKPKVVIPCHYNTWPLIAADPAAWAERVNAETGSRAVVLHVGESHTLAE
jgi:L-ascorbate metabolism protein UlaG (beta-lactamase superfamily)